MKENSQKLQVIMRNSDELKENLLNSRIHSEKQINQISRSITKLGFNNPILIDANNTVIAGHGRLAAAKSLKMRKVPTICLEHLSPDEVRAYIIADNKLAENAGWDEDILKIELEYLMSIESDLEFDATITGFEIPEIDIIVNPEVIDNNLESDPADELPNEDNVQKRVNSGDLWALGTHRLYCGSSLEEYSFKKLMSDEVADVIFSDPPYNVAISGNVTKQKHHKEFLEASGELSEVEFREFLETTFKLQCKYSKQGSIHFQCMDWRHMSEILTAGKTYSELKNVCVWDKITAGMGSLYRSQQELIFVFKNGIEPHQNNIELGVHGRYRTNVWKYKGMHASNPQARSLCKLHPTVKPTAMIMDALLDVSSPNGIVLDCFGGSGSTLIAAEKVKRKARLIELDEHYCDVILYRWENYTGQKAQLISNNKEDNDGE